MLTHFKVMGLWGWTDIRLEFREEVAIIIGPNGCGKTTVLELINALTSWKVKTLFSIEYSSVMIKLVTDTRDQYEIKSIQKLDDQNDKLVDLRFENTTEQKILYAGKNIREQHIEGQEEFGEWKHVRATLEKIINPKHIFSIYHPNHLAKSQMRAGRRARDPYTGEGSKRTPDFRVGDILRQIRLDYGTRTHSAAEVTREYIEDALLELLFQKKGQEAAKERKSSNKSITIETLRDLQLPYEKVRLSVSNQIYGSAREIDATEMVELLNNGEIYERIESIIPIHQQYAEEIDAIYATHLLFIEIMNDLFQNIEAVQDSLGEVTFYVGEKQELDPVRLSSGQKQIFCILGEALLLDGRTDLVLTDEPELSLHIEWQRGIMRNFARLKPGVQIICATHAPEIAAGFAENLLYLPDYTQSFNA